MKIVEIVALENGAHRNQEFHGSVPDGWAIVPDDLVCENFPFGEITVDESIPPVVLTWTPVDIPESEDAPRLTTAERVKALEEENNLLKAQIAAQSDQMDFYEDCIVEMAAIVYA